MSFRQMLSRLAQSAKKLVAFLLSPVRWLVQALFGQLYWQPPRWFNWMTPHVDRARSSAVRHPRTTAACLIAVLAVGVGTWYGWQWWQTRPKPVVVEMNVSDPSITSYEEDDNPQPYPARIAFSRPVARIELADKDVPDGISVSPAIEGTWHWQEDDRLIFTPKRDWPVGMEYTVTFDQKKVFRPEARFDTDTVKFNTAPFNLDISNASFYQDPNDPAGKKVVATINFSHPVDTQDFGKRITLRMAGQSTGVLGMGGETTAFQVTYDKKKLHAYVHSVPLPIPDTSSRLIMTIDKGARSTLGGAGTDRQLTREVTVPGINTLIVSDMSPLIVTNEKFEPEQALMVSLSMLTHERQVNDNIQAWLLPEKWPADAKVPRQWSGSDVPRIGPEVLAAGATLKLQPVPADQEITTDFSYRFSAPPGRYIYVKVNKGVTSFGGYRLAKDDISIFRVPDFPAEVRIMAQGSLLALSGEKKLPVLARDVAGLRFEIARVLPQYLPQLVDFGIKSNGNFSEPDFEGEIDESYLTESYSEEITLPTVEPGKAQYRSLDFSKYLNGGRRGVFLLRVQAWDPEEKSTTGEESRRLVVVTDLGIIDKRSIDDGHDLFVQSVNNGQPVAGASVEVIGRNGQTTVQGTTDAGGHVRLNSLKGLERERTPVMFLARKGQDVSFLPYKPHGNYNRRTLDFSRFDVGGIDDSQDAGKLSAYLFSDRGIYRPGEEMRIGMIVRTADWARSAQGLPLEAEVVDARGMTVKRDRVTVPAAGFMDLRYTTQDTSPTGNYTVNLYLVKDDHADTLIGSATVKVQDFEPDRLRMSARFSRDAAEGWISPDDLALSVSLQNLFGTPAENRRITGRMVLSPGALNFPRYRGYVFTDPQRAKDAVSEQLAETQTDEKGEATLPLDLQRFAPATYRVHVMAQGFEADGGRGVAAEASVLVSNLPYLVGYKPDGDYNYVRRNSTRSVELIAIDPNAKQTATGKLTLQRVEKRYVSVLAKQNDGTYRYESREKQIQLAEESITIGKDGLRIPLDTSTPGNFNLVVRDANGLEYARIAYAVAGEANITQRLDKNAELKLTLSRRDYAPGQTIEVQVQAPYTGNGLITIERDKVYSYAWFRTTTTSSVQRIKLPAGIEGNAYLTVTFVRDPASDEIYASPLSYAAEPFSIDLDARKLNLTVQSPDLMKPGETARFHLASDKPARAVIFAVDEGVLQVARYQKADPLGYFFQKRALQVSTSQILDLILPEFSRVMAAAAPGGDADGALGRFLNPFKRKRDPAVAYWSGIVDVGPGGRDFTWQVPESFNGTLRVMAVAVSPDAVGISDRKTLVRGDFVLSPNAPMTVAPGDEFDMSVGVSNNVAESGANAKVAVTLDAGKQFEVIGAPRVEAPIAANREGVVHFRLRAAQNPGAGALRLTAAIGAKQSKLSTEVSVRPLTMYQQKLTAGVLAGGKQAEVPITRHMFGEYRNLRATMSPLPLGFSPGLVAYLDNYPYSCTEQLVSQAVPALILSKRPELGSVMKKQTSLADTIQMLRSRQNEEGAYGLWAANQDVVPEASLWAQQFLLEAKDRGQNVPADLIARGNTWLKSFAAEDGESLYDNRLHAQAIYLLTRQGQSTGNLAAALQKRMDARDKSWKRDIAAVYLAGAYQLLKQERLAEAALSDFRLGEMPDGNGRYVNYSAQTDPLASMFYDSESMLYDGMSRDAAAIVILARHFPARFKALPANAFDPMLTALQRGWYSSFSSGQLLLALDAMADAAGEAPGAKYAITEVLAGGKTRDLTLPSGIMPTAPYGADVTRLRLHNTGNSPAFYAVDESGFDLTPPTAEVRAGLEVIREYTDAQGKPVATVKQGDEVFVHLKFRSTKGIASNIALVDLLPGGFELVPNAAPARDEDAQDEESEYEDSEQHETSPWQLPFGEAKGDWQPDYADVREDRIVLYANAEPGLHEFVYRIKATNIGSFGIPPTYGESMYQRTVKAIGKAAGKLTVEAAKK